MFMFGKVLEWAHFKQKEKEKVCGLKFQLLNEQKSFRNDARHICLYFVYQRNYYFSCKKSFFNVIHGRTCFCFFLLHLAMTS